MGIGAGSTSPSAWRSGGKPTNATGPRLAIKMEKKMAGFSCEAQRM